MTYAQFIEKTDLLILALSTCALTYQDAKFDYLSKKLDHLYTEHPEHHAIMVAKRNQAA